jgi:hypothetical protein
MVADATSTAAVTNTNVTVVAADVAEIGEALEEQGPAPCDTCPLWDRCSTGRVACRAFSDWVYSRRSVFAESVWQRSRETEPHLWQPDAETFAQLFPRSTETVQAFG